jgi:hypothetical protein
MSVASHAKPIQFKAGVEAGNPRGSVSRSVIEYIRRATSEHGVSGAIDRAMEIGDKAPAHSLQNSEGNLVHLAIARLTVARLLRYVVDRLEGVETRRQRVKRRLASIGHGCV